LKWIRENVGLFAMCVSSGIAWGAITVKVNNNSDRLKDIENQKTDRLVVKMEFVEKRVDAHDALLIKMNDKLDSMNEKLARIASTIGGGK